MAKPRIFISSTYFDLHHIRASLERFVQGYGFEPVLSEKGQIGYVHDKALDESCYRAASKADMFLMIIGGRSGSPASDSSLQDKTDFHTHYDSITRNELRAALKADIPIFMFLDSAVSQEYQIYSRNKGNPTVVYAAVDSVNVFSMLDEIYTLKKNNQVSVFDRYSQIEDYLKHQWASLFLELLQSKRKDIDNFALSQEIEKLRDLSNTLKVYLEKMVSNESDGDEVVIAENQRLQRRSAMMVLLNSHIWDMLQKADVPEAEAADVLMSIVLASKDQTSFVEMVEQNIDHFDPFGLHLLTDRGEGGGCTLDWEYPDTKEAVLKAMKTNSANQY